MSEPFDVRESGSAPPEAAVPEDDPRARGGARTWEPVGTLVVAVLIGYS